MKRDKGKKGGGRETQKKSRFPPLPHSDCGVLFFRVFQKHFCSSISQRWFNQRTFDFLLLNHLLLLNEYKSVFVTPWKEEPAIPMGEGRKPTLFLCLSSPSLFSFVSFHIKYWERRGGMARGQLQDMFTDLLRN